MPSFYVSSNNMLFQEYNAKLSDFGLAKDGPEEGKTHVSTRVMGTYGYAAPEYVMTGEFWMLGVTLTFAKFLLMVQFYSCWFASSSDFLASSNLDPMLHINFPHHGYFTVVTGTWSFFMKDKVSVSRRRIVFTFTSICAFILNAETGFYCSALALFLLFSFSSVNVENWFILFCSRVFPFVLTWFLFFCLRPSDFKKRCLQLWSSSAGNDHG